MNGILALLVLLLPSVLVLSAVAGELPGDAAEWTIYITNDNCPDYTWGLTEPQTRQAFADIVRGHLDEMKRTDNEPPGSRDRYNMAVTQEALCFVECYPDRRDELIRRIQEGRVFISPYLCNSLWGFQSVEGAIRTFYPARRLERDWGIPVFDVAEHIEQPSLPCGVASILAGCGIRWLSNPFYAYDSTFGGLKNPPLFILEGPDGSPLRVVMDPWASNKSSYTQGAQVLRDKASAVNEWLPHYGKLGAAYPLRAILASGTHGDINPGSGGQARAFADAIIAYNGQPGAPPNLVNAALPQFCNAVDEAQARAPFLQTLRGSFGDSWDLWPVCLAKYVADMREGERAFLAADALLATAFRSKPDLHDATRADRERAEWCWAMLSDHAWNGTDENNKRHNAELRRTWCEELNRLSQKLLKQGWQGLGLRPGQADVTVFNSQSVEREDIVRIEAAADFTPAGAQVVDEDGRHFAYFLSPLVPGFGFALAALVPGAEPPRTADLYAASTLLECPYYRLSLDAKTGGITSLIHKPTNTELVVPGKGRTLCQTVYFDGQEHNLSDVRSEVAALGPVLARLRITGMAAGIRVTTFVTVYSHLDRVDFDVRISKPVSTKEERLCQVFPVLRDGAVLRIESTGAVLRPRPAPEGDLLPGADPRRCAVQGFVDVSLPNGPGVTIAPLDAYALRLDLDPITFEALGNDQNYREVVQDQNKVTEFRFRYALRAHAGGYDGAKAFAWSRSVATPLLATIGKVPGTDPPVGVDPKRAIATCLKPADGDASGGCILRIWETAGRAGPLSIAVPGYKKVLRTDLLERDKQELQISRGWLTIDLRAHGFAALRLLP